MLFGMNTEVPVGNPRLSIYLIDNTILKGHLQPLQIRIHGFLYLVTAYLYTMVRIMGPYLIGALHTIMIIAITVMILEQPNGVDFALVAGACCLLKFSNTVGYSGNSTTQITLNINSTGAKPISTGNFATNSTFYNHRESGSLMAYMNNTTEPLLIYNGTLYLNASHCSYYDTRD